MDTTDPPLNLATRCLSCGTVFRVAEDQLLASDGWVRCGRCNGVFNATEVLFDVDTGTPMRLALPPAATEPALAPYQAPDRTPDQTPDQTPERPQADLPRWAAPAPAPRQEPGFAPPPAAARNDPDEPLLRAPSRASDDNAADEPIFITDHVPPPVAADQLPATAGTASADGPALLAAPAAALAAASATGTAVASDAAAMAAAAASAPLAMPQQAAPSFMRQAERSAIWRHPAVRGGLWAGVLLLGLAALLQMTLLWRNSLAAHLPRSAPALQALCSLAGCSVQPLRRIQQLSVDSSGLNRLEGSSLYRLQLVLRNRADPAVMMPALDLTLTGPQGELVARRVLPVAALGVPQASLQAGQELPIKVLVSTGDRRVDGYTLELFYP